MSFTSALLIRVEKAEAEDVLKGYFTKLNEKGRRGEKAGRGPVQRGLTIRACRGWKVQPEDFLSLIRAYGLKVHLVLFNSKG